MQVRQTRRSTMRGPIAFAVSNVLLSGMLLLQTGGRLHGEMVIGNAPNTFNAPNQANIKHLNDLYTAGKIGFSEYQADLLKLEKSIDTVSGADSVTAVGKVSGQSDAGNQPVNPISPTIDGLYKVSGNTIKAVSNAAANAQGLCAAGYTDEPTSQSNEDFCTQTVLEPDGYHQDTNDYFLQNGLPKLYQSFTNNGVTIKTTFDFGMWDQFIGSTGAYVNFFVADQDQANTIAQEATASGWSVTFDGKNVEGYYQVQALVFLN